MEYILVKTMHFENGEVTRVDFTNGDSVDVTKVKVLAENPYPFIPGTKATDIYYVSFILTQIDTPIDNIVVQYPHIRLCRFIEPPSLRKLIKAPTGS
jgi:hypothetical protein